MAGTLAPRRLGRYRLVERLGQGSTAEVWRIETAGPAGFRRTLVGKRLLPQLASDSAFTSLLIEEAKLSARIDHANVVRVFDLEQVDGEYLLTMEHVDGCELRALLAMLSTEGPPPVGLGVWVAHEIARGLAHVHALRDEAGRPLGVVHRDVSPSNILLSKGGAAKLADFGVARALLESRRGEGAVVGNLAYMAPEQLAAQAIDARADVYALGVVLHECLTGRRLWKGAYDVAGMRALRARPVPPPSLANPAVSAVLDAIVARATASEPADRYESAAALVEALAPLLDFSPAELAALVARVPRRVEEGRERRTLTHAGRRRPSPWLFAAMGLALVAAGVMMTRVPTPHAPPPPPSSPAPVAVQAPPPPAPPAAQPKPRASTAAPGRRAPGKTPNLVHGTLVDPFSR